MYPWLIGGNKPLNDWNKHMARPVHNHELPTPHDMLLPIQGNVSEEDFRQPPGRDIHNTKTLLAVKNGRTTGTTFGRVNGLESITRHYPGHGIAQDALEFIVCGYDTVTDKEARFSDAGDSGSLVAGRDGRIIGQLTGGAGTTDQTDKMYVTPFYAPEKAIEKEFPDCHLL